MEDWIPAIVTFLGGAAAVYVAIRPTLKKLAARDGEDIWDKIDGIATQLDPVVETFTEWNDPKSNAVPPSPQNPTGNDPTRPNPR